MERPMRPALLLLPLTLAACASDQNYGLETRHAPVVAGNAATVAGCPDWTDAASLLSAGATARNYGCASATNLAAMIADPADLVRGRTGDAGTDGRVSVKAIKVWRDMTPSGDAALKKSITQEAATGGGSQ